MEFNWHCPHCNHKVTISDQRFSSDFHILTIKHSEGAIGLASRFIVCPNPECRKPTLNVSLRNWTINSNGHATPTGNAIREWRLLPFGDARPYPEFVPAAIRQDYEEACLIRDLSAKASATLARRALQGILRDYYKVKPRKLVDEINQLKDTMEPELLDAIHGVRTVGNIGAHMEADIDVIVDVDPGEAQLLIELVETLIEETYVRRDQRTKRLQKVSALSKEKEDERRKPPQAAEFPTPSTKEA